MKGGGGRGIREAGNGHAGSLQDQAVSAGTAAAVYHEKLHAGRDIPILFSAPMVRALLDGRKTQTRRLMKPQPERLSSGHFHVFNAHGGSVGVPEREVPGIAPDYVRYMVGDRLWVRETWQTGMDYAGPQIAYRATGDTHAIDAWDDEDDGVGPSFNYARCPSAKWHTWLPDLLSGAEGSWRPGIHMPRWASRLTLSVTDVRVERLQDISEADARAEGMPVTWDGKGYNPPPPEVDSWQGYGRASFSLLWSEINGKGSWEANPWVVALTFTVHRANIDALPSSLPGRAQA